MSEPKTINVGDHVLFTDEYRRDHDALVTAVHGDPYKTPAVNLLFVAKDEERTDQYGRQIERSSSVVHIQNQSARAMCWRHFVR